jgi:hypothetical protein
LERRQRGIATLKWRRCLDTAWESPVSRGRRPLEFGKEEVLIIKY